MYISDKRLHSVNVFQIYYLYINKDSLIQYIWTSVAPHYVNFIRSYIKKYYIIIIIINNFTCERIHDRCTISTMSYE